MQIAPAKGKRDNERGCADLASIDRQSQGVKSLRGIN
jgi:hypothetical protein